MLSAAKHLLLILEESRFFGLHSQNDMKIVSGNSANLNRNKRQQDVMKIGSDVRQRFCLSRKAGKRGTAEFRETAIQC